MLKLYFSLFFSLLLGTCHLIAEDSLPSSTIDVSAKTSPLILLTWQHDPTTTMIIQWLTPVSDTANNVYFRPSEEQKWDLAEAASTPFPQLPYLVHRVELTGLKPNSSYSFKINNEKQQYHFSTMPSTLSRAIRFAEGGDLYHDSIDLVKETSRQAMKNNLDFVLFGGDLAYSTAASGPEHPQRWIDLLRSWHETMITSDGRVVPIIAAIGNHEVVGGYGQNSQKAACYCTVFSMPGNQGYGVLDFGNYMTLLLLDSGHTHPIEGEQTAWLHKALKERPEVTHKFAAYHVPAYPSCRSYNAKMSPTIRHHWVPLFEKYDLHVAFEHHDHAYKRTHSLKKGKIDPEGIVYLGDGAWGIAEPRKTEINKRTWFLAKASPTRHFILATIDGKGRSFKAIDAFGNVIDTYEKLISFGS